MPRKPRSTDPHKLRDADRLPLMIAMRIKGETLAAIGRAVGLSESRACEILTRAMNERAQLIGAAVETLRAIEAERLDLAQVVTIGIMLNEPEMRADGKPGKRKPKSAPDRQLKAVGTLIKIMERRARLFGLDLGKGDSIAIDPGEELLEALRAGIAARKKGQNDAADGERSRGNHGPEAGGDGSGVPGIPD